MKPHRMAGTIRAAIAGFGVFAQLPCEFSRQYAKT
jgi:hypothetical protein